MWEHPQSIENDLHDHPTEDLNPKQHGNHDHSLENLQIKEDVAHKNIRETIQDLKYPAKQEIDLDTK